MFPVVVVFLSGSLPTAAADVPPAVQRAAVAATVRVAGRGQVGSGVVVGVRDGSAYVLTAAHVAPSAEEREVATFAAPLWPAARTVYGKVAVAERLPRPDVVLLKVPVGSADVAVLPLAGPGRRPKAYPFAALAVGCDGDPVAPRPYPVTVRGRAARSPNGGVAFFWETAEPPAAGQSGGPLVSADGRVIGLCTAASGGRGYYTHLDEILAGLKRQNKSYAWLWENP